MINLYNVRTLIPSNIHKLVIKNLTIFNESYKIVHLLQRKV